MSYPPPPGGYPPPDPYPGAPGGPPQYWQESPKRKGMAIDALVLGVLAVFTFWTIVGGILWTGATKAGALAGLTGGFLAWIYTLLLPSFARSGWIGESFVHDGPFGLALLRPYELLGLSGLDSIAHALFWTMVVNVGLYVAVSLVTSQTIIEFRSEPE